MVRNLALSSSAAFLCLLNAGCGPEAPPIGDPSEPALRLPASRASSSEDDPCGAAQLHELLQRHDSPAIRAAVSRFAGEAPVRWIAPGMAVTADYAPERLNLILDEDGRIATMRCG